MDFSNFVKLFYVKGYFETKPKAVLALLKGSVEYPKKIEGINTNTLNGFINGNPITSLAKMLIEAELSVDKMNEYIKKLYPKKPRTTKSYKDYQGKTYKDALYDHVKDKIDGITPDTMSNELAMAFFELIQEAIAESVVKPVRMASIEYIVKLRKDISKILSKMITIGRYIADPSDADAAAVADDGSKKVSIQNLCERLSVKLSQLYEKASSLHDCNAPYLETAINKVFISIQGISKNDFILTKKEFMLESSRSYRLHHLLEALTQLQNEAEKQSESQ